MRHLIGAFFGVFVPIVAVEMALNVISWWVCGAVVLAYWTGLYVGNEK